MMKIVYISGSRADFGLFENALKILDAAQDIDLSIIVTGQHLVAKYGDTHRYLVDSGLKIVGRVPVKQTGATGKEMGEALAEQLKCFLECLFELKPDLVLVLGDRGEMLAGALAAVHLGIHVGHVHGGELSGTLDESFRHAISKLAHYHFPAQVDSVSRLEKLGERRDRIWPIGAPGLDQLFIKRPKYQDGWLCTEFSLVSERPTALILFHPVVQEVEEVAHQTSAIFKALIATNFNGIILKPNSDAGGIEIESVISSFQKSGRFVLIDHLARDMYLKCLANCDLLIGNSSSGIIESASLGVSCVNVGSRQNNRLRNDNVVDCPTFEPASLVKAIEDALLLRPPFENKFGAGNSGEQLLTILRQIEFDPNDLKKQNSY
jgi:UDP-hydrolysing UDP-N-acetyl-D-glucosamine 2-epimerase